MDKHQEILLRLQNLGRSIDNIRGRDQFDWQIFQQLDKMEVNCIHAFRRMDKLLVDCRRIGRETIPYQEAYIRAKECLDTTEQYLMLALLSN